MEKVYEELDEVKSTSEKLKMDNRNKTELLDNLKKVQNEQLVEIREARLVTEKQGFELEERTKEISELKLRNEDLLGLLREKDSLLKRVNEANEKLEVEKQRLMVALDEVSEKNIDMEEKNNVFKAEIEGLKGLLEAVEKRKLQDENTAKALKELRGRDDVVIKLEEEKTRIEENLKWKKEQFKHLEEAYEKIQNLFKASKKESEEERKTLLDQIYSLQTKLDSQTRISEDLEKKLQMCNSVLTQEETRRKHLEIQVSEIKARYEDAFAEYQDVRTQLDDLACKRDEEVAELRGSLSSKEAYFKEMKYENGKLKQENHELLVSLKELQEATIQGSGNSAISKVKNKLRSLENIHKNCSANLRSKEAEWSSQLEKMVEEINDYKLQLESKEAAVKELENCLSSTDKMRLHYEEISIMFLVLSKTVSEKREEQSYSLVMEQLEQKNVALAKAHLQMHKEVERYKETVEESSRFQTQMKENSKAAEKDYEEKLVQVCDALDNTNTDLVAEREKVVALTRQIESFGVVKEKNLVMEKEIQKYKEMLEESEKSRLLLKELESDSKENIKELCTKLDEEVKKTASLIRKPESMNQNEEYRHKELAKYKEKLEEAIKSQLLLQEALETANSELSDTTSEVCQIEFELCVLKSNVKRLKAELEQNQNLRKRVEASLLEQVGVGEGMRQERNELLLKLKAISSERETHIQTLKNLQREVELLEQESLKRELEDAVFAHITSSKKLEESVACFRQEATKLRTELTTSEAEKAELVKEISSLSSEKRNMFCLISELENGISKMCDGDTMVMKDLERVKQSCDGFGKENKNGETIGSPRWTMKHDDVVTGDRSPFRQINH